MPEFDKMSSRSGMAGRIAKAALTASLIAACADLVGAGFDGVLLGAPRALADAGGFAAGGSGFDASAGDENTAGGTGNAGGVAGAAGGSAATDAADSNGSAERDAKGDTDANSPPVAADGTLAIVEGTQQRGRLPSFDADGDVLDHRIEIAPVLGAVRITNTRTGEFEYSSSNGAYGRDSFTYQVNDRTSDGPRAGRIEVTVVALGPLRAESDVVPVTHNGFGKSVDIEGDTAVAGAWAGPGAPGAAYVMRRDARGAWQVTQRITEELSAEQFGQQVALTGDWLIVTASGLYVADPRPGEAYFYKRQNKDAPFTFKHKVLAPRPAEYDRYGSALAVHGDLAVIGARGDRGTLLPDGGADIVLSGAVYVYRCNAADEWRPEKTIVPPDPDVEGFGWGVGVYGDTLAVSARLKSDAVTQMVHLFVREGDQWKLHSTPPLRSARGIAGESIAVNADNVLVSNPDGYVVAYTRQLNGWQLGPLIAGPGGMPPDYNLPEHFGFPVAMHGDTAIVGALADRFGEAYVFHLRRGAPGLLRWDFSGRKLTAGERMSDEVNDFGYGIAFEGTTAVIGAPAEWQNGRFGAVYFFGIAPPGG